MSTMSFFSNRFSLPGSVALCGAGVLLLSAVMCARAEDALRAGVASCDITPTKPVTLAGYGARKDLSRGVHDPLSARVLAFEQGGKRLVLVSTDLIGFYSGTAEVVRKAIIEACRLEPSELFLCGIHTHSAPTLALAGSEAHANNIEYTEWLKHRLVAVVREALGRATPAWIGFGAGASPVGINRRQAVTDKDGKRQIRLGRNPGTLTDREVQVLKVGRAEKGEAAAVLFGYATHSTSLGGKNLIISGDVHGLAEQFVEKHLGGGVVAPGFAGASGDVDPWCRVLPEFKTANGWIPEPVLLGTLLGEEVVDVANAIQKLEAKGPVATAMKTVDLPRKTLDEAEKKRARILSVFNVTVGRVGDVAFVGLGGEVFNEIGRAIKDASPFPHTVVVTHCNGAGGYVPTKESYPEGGYEVTTSPFLPEAAEMLAQEAVRLLETLK
jgi:hypothetical protein